MHETVQAWVEKHKMHRFARELETALPCFGCSHSAAQLAPPAGPSGERPCCMCVRNPDVRANGPMEIHDRSCPKNPGFERSEAAEAAQRMGASQPPPVCNCKPKYLSSFYNGDLNEKPEVFDNYRTMDMRDVIEKAYSGGLKTQTRDVLHVMLDALTKKFGKEIVRELVAADSTRRLLGEE